MARLPSLRRPVIETMKAEATRIRKRQEKALARLKRLEEHFGTEPRGDAPIKQAEEDAALTEKEISALEAAAKVAALLERVPEKDEDDEEKPISAEEKAERLARLERTGPARVARVVDEEDGT